MVGLAASRLAALDPGVLVTIAKAHGWQTRRAMAKVAKWGIGTGPALHWRTVVDDVRIYGSGHSIVLVEMGIVRVCP